MLKKKRYIRIYLQGLQSQEFMKLIQASAFIKHTKNRLKEYVVNQKN